MVADGGGNDVIEHELQRLMTPGLVQDGPSEGEPRQETTQVVDESTRRVSINEDNDSQEDDNEYDYNGAQSEGELELDTVSATLPSQDVSKSRKSVRISQAPTSSLAVTKPVSGLRGSERASKQLSIDSFDSGIDKRGSNMNNRQSTAGDTRSKPMPMSMMSEVSTSRESRRASFAMQMLLPLQGGSGGGSSSRSGSRKVSESIDVLPSTSTQTLGRTRSDVKNVKPPTPRGNRDRSSSFALNNTTAIAGFQDKMNSMAAEGNGPAGRKSMALSRKSLSLTSFGRSSQAPERKDSLTMAEGEHEDEDSDEIVAPVTKKASTVSICTDRSDDSDESGSNEDSDEELGRRASQEFDSSTKNQKAALNRRFTRQLPKLEELSDDSDDKQENLPFVFTNRANFIFGGLILVNAAYIGFETDCVKDVPYAFWFTCESLFLVVFGVELVLRIKDHQKQPLDFDEDRTPWYMSSWNLLDTFLVIMGFVDTAVVGVFVHLIFDYDVETGDLQIFRVIRLARVIRLVRVFRIFRFMHELLVLAKGIIAAMKALVWAMLLVFLTLYTCSIFTTKMMGQEVRSENEHFNDVQDWFGSVAKSLFTLFQLMTLEEWSGVARVIMDSMNGYAWLWGAFFVFFVMFTHLVLMNLVTGVILENVLSISRREEEKALQKEEAHRVQTVFKIHSLFDTVLGDRETDELTIEEFRHATRNPKVVKQLARLQIAVYEAEELFVLMDTAKRGAINIDHFIEGCLRIRGAARAKHLLAVQFDVQKVWSKLSDQLDEVEDNVILELQRSSQDILDNVQESMQESLQDNMQEVIQEAVKQAAEDAFPAILENSVQQMVREAALDGARTALQEFAEGRAASASAVDAGADAGAGRGALAAGADAGAGAVDAPIIRLSVAAPAPPAALAGVAAPQATELPAMPDPPSLPGEAWVDSQEIVRDAEDLDNIVELHTEDRAHQAVERTAPSPAGGGRSSKRCPSKNSETPSPVPSDMPEDERHSEEELQRRHKKKKKSNAVAGEAEHHHHERKHHHHERSQRKSVDRPMGLSARVHEHAHRLLDLRREEEGLLKRVENVARSRHLELCHISSILGLEEDEQAHGSHHHHHHHHHHHDHHDHHGRSMSRSTSEVLHRQPSMKHNEEENDVCVSGSRASLARSMSGTGDAFHQARTSPRASATGTDEAAAAHCSRRNSRSHSSRRTSLMVPTESCGGGKAKKWYD